MAIYQNKDTPFDFRQGIQMRLDVVGMSRSELARRIQKRGACDTETVMRFMRGDTETSTKVVSHIMSELGIRVQVPTNDG